MKGGKKRPISMHRGGASMEIRLRERQSFFVCLSHSFHICISQMQFFLFNSRATFLRQNAINSKIRTWSSAILVASVSIFVFFFFSFLCVRKMTSCKFCPIHVELGETLTKFGNYEIPFMRKKRKIERNKE